MTMRQQIEEMGIEIAELNATLAEVSEAITKGRTALDSFNKAVNPPVELWDLHPEWFGK